MAVVKANPNEAATDKKLILRPNTYCAIEASAIVKKINVPRSSAINTLTNWLLIIIQLPMMLIFDLVIKT